MSEISANLVKELREKTNAGMMDCKKALTESGGDLAAAEELLRKKGIASAGKKASRAAKEGTIASYDYEPSIRVQTRSRPEGFDVPADSLAAPFRNPVEYLIHCLSNDLPIEGPLSTTTSRTGQRIVDTAFLSALQKKTLPLVP
jgi:hypothetical protein